MIPTKTPCFGIKIDSYGPIKQHLSKSFPFFLSSAQRCYFTLYHYFTLYPLFKSLNLKLSNLNLCSFILKLELLLSYSGSPVGLLSINS